MTIITLHESPSMCWYRINTERRERKNLPPRNPTDAEVEAWKKSCEQNKEGARKIYLALRQTIECEEHELECIQSLMTIMKKEKKRLPWMHDIFGDLY